MRYKEHTINKVEGQIQKLESIQRGMEARIITAPDALNILKTVIKELKTVTERLQLEPNE